MEIISREAARAAGVKRYFTGVACNHGHVAERLVSSKLCVVCNRKKAERQRDAVRPGPNRKILEHDRSARILAREMGRLRYPSLNPCKRGHTGDRYTKSTQCVTCTLFREDRKPLPPDERLRRHKDRMERRAKERLKTETEKKAARSKAHVELRRKKRAEDPVYSLAHRMRAVIANALASKGYKKNSKTQEILGCSPAFFATHIERQFLPGMHWGNRELWQIDHIVALATAKTIEEVLSLNHFTNLRPLWKEQNRKKWHYATHLI